MSNLSEEQIDFLEQLSKWIDSSENKHAIYQMICIELELSISKNTEIKKKQRCNILREILINEKDNYAKGELGPLVKKAIEYMHSQISLCCKFDFIRKPIFEHINKINLAQNHLQTSSIKTTIPSETSLDGEIKNRYNTNKIEILLSILDEWIANSNNFINIPADKVSAIRKKYHKYKKEFIRLKSCCSICTLSNYIDKPEEAKAFLSEIFTKEQEEFYLCLEKWAKNEIENKDCSKWVYSFLQKERNLRIQHIRVLKFIGNEAKAKEFLFSIYKIELSNKLKKKLEIENAKKSIFDNFNDYSSSIDSFFCNLQKDTKLFSICISSNNFGRVDPLTIISEKDGIIIQNDCIKLSIVEYHLSLRTTNRLFYTYTSTYKKRTRVFTFFSMHALDIIKEYASQYLCHDVVEHTKACVVVSDFKYKDSPICYTCFLTDDASLFCSDPIFRYKLSKTKNRFYHDNAGYRFVSKALIWHLLKDKTKSIDFNPTKDFSTQERESIQKIIQEYYNEMSFEDRYICHFIDSAMYKFPVDSLKTEQFKKKSLLHRILNLKNSVTYQYGTKVLEDKDFPFAKIRFLYGDTTFENLVNSIGRSISRDEYVDLWFDSDNRNFLIHLRTLLFLNWASVSGDTGKIKKITACWLLVIIYNQFKVAFPKDKIFWRLLLAYVLIENESVFDTLIDGMIFYDNLNLSNIKVSGIVKTLTQKSNEQLKKLSFKQRLFLSRNLFKCFFFDNYNKKNKEVKSCKLNVAEQIIKSMCDMLALSKENLKYYSQDKLLEKLINMPTFIIPDNFTYRNGNRGCSFLYNRNYRGTYAHDVMEYSNSDIDTIFDGDPDAYWNID